MDSGNQSATNSEDLSSGSSSGSLTPHESKATTAVLTSGQTQDDLVMNFRCLQRQNSGGNLLLLQTTSPLKTPVGDPFSSPPRSNQLRTSSSLSQISCIEGSPAPTIKTVIDKSSNNNNSSSNSSNNSQIPPTKTPPFTLLPSTTSRGNRTLGDMEREMAEMQKTIVDLRLRLELYYEKSHGKFANSSDSEVRQVAAALEGENRALREKTAQLEADLAKALETYPQLVAELNAARNKLAYVQKQQEQQQQQQIVTVSSATWTDFPPCLKCEETAKKYDLEKCALSALIDQENRSKILELETEKSRLNEALKIETDKFEKAKIDFENSEKSNADKIATFEVQLASLNAELEMERELRQRATIDGQKRVQVGAEKVATLTRELEQLRLEAIKSAEEVTQLQRDLAAKEDLLKTHKQTSLWELEDVKRRYDELESSKREEIAFLEAKIGESQKSPTSNNNEDCDLGLPRSTSSPVASTPPDTNSNLVAQLFDQNKDAMLSAMGSELAKFAKQLTVRDKAILGLTKMLQKQNLQVAEEFKSVLNELKCGGHLNENSVLNVVKEVDSQQTQVEDNFGALCEYFLKLLNILQLSDDETALKEKISEIENALLGVKNGDEAEEEEVFIETSDDALLNVKRRIQVLEVANRFLNGEIALACSERDRILGTDEKNNNNNNSLVCVDCDALKLQVGHWVDKYRRLKKDFRALLKSNVQTGELAAGSLHSICKKCELVDGEYREAIEQKDLVIERLIADLANFDHQANKRAAAAGRNQQEANGRKSASAQTDCNCPAASSSRSRSNSVTAVADYPSSGSNSITNNATMRPPSTTTTTIDSASVADLQKYLPKLWKRLGKLRSFVSSLFTEQKIYEAIITARLQPMSDVLTGSSDSSSSGFGPTFVGDLKTLRTLGCRLSTAISDVSALEENIRALEKRCLRRYPTTTKTASANSAEKQPPPRDRRCESVSPCRRCNCNSISGSGINIICKSPLPNHPAVGLSIASNEIDHAKFEMGELFAEIQTLKDQLQRAIMTNSALKSKLEEQVSGSISSNNNNNIASSTSSDIAAAGACGSNSSTARPLQFAQKRTGPQQGDVGLNSPPGSDIAPSVAEFNDNLTTKPPPNSDKRGSPVDQMRPGERVPSTGRFSSISPARNHSASPAAAFQTTQSPCDSSQNGHGPYSARKASNNNNNYGSIEGNNSNESTSTMTCQHINRRSAAPMSDRLGFNGNHRTRGASAHPTITSATSGVSNSSPNGGQIPRSSSSELRQTAPLSTLYAVGRLEEFEHLKREIEESFSVLRSLENKVKARLSVLVHQQQHHGLNNGNTSSSSSASIHALTTSEALHLKELQLSASELRVCLNQQKQLTQQFAINQLPPVNARGKYVDVELLSENTQLIDAVTSWKSKYEAAERLLRAMQERLEQRNRAKEVAETAIYNKLACHEEALQQVRSNLHRTFGTCAAPDFVTSRPPRLGASIRMMPLPDKHAISPKH